MKRALLLTCLVYGTVNRSYSSPVAQTKSNNVIYIDNEAWDISDPAITFEYPAKQDNVPILLEEDTFYGNLNNNYVPDNNGIDLTNLEYLPEYSDKQSDDTFICIGSPKCPNYNDNNNNKDNLGDKDIIEDGYIIIDNKNHGNDEYDIDTTEDSLCNEEPTITITENHDNINNNVLTNYTDTKQNSTIDFDLLYLLYDLISNISTDKSINPITNNENGNTGNINANLPGILTNIIKNNVFINEYRPINTDLANKETLDFEKSKESINSYKKDKNKNATGQDNNTSIKDFKLNKPLINIINNTISIDSNNSIKLPKDKNKPSKVIVHIFNNKEHGNSSESKGDGADNVDDTNSNNDVENKTEGSIPTI